MQQAIQFFLDLSYQEYLAVYKGHAEHVITRSYDGRTIRFPANILKPHLTRKGIHGAFIIKFDSNNKFQALEKLK